MQIFKSILLIPFIISKPDWKKKTFIYSFEVNFLCHLYFKSRHGDLFIYKAETEGPLAIIVHCDYGHPYIEVDTIGNGWDSYFLCVPI